MAPFYTSAKQKNTCDVDYLRLSTTRLRVGAPGIGRQALDETRVAQEDSNMEPDHSPSVQREK